MTAHRCRDKARELSEIAARTTDPVAREALEGLALEWAALATKTDEDLMRRLKG